MPASAHSQFISFVSSHPLQSFYYEEFAEAFVVLVHSRDTLLITCYDLTTLPPRKADV